ncbi:transcriptional regulator domain-containing protein [Mesorhizobium sp. AaZ16]|uniref:transcriptional regulator domain-containing protein n=1 Tax=Mesorhizobium sp. AaZ16 TaxID=3402289 RepID=UPI00374F8590
MRATECRSGWPDWHHDSAYDYVSRLPRTAWAWEFLRRNPKFQRDYAKTAPAFTVRRHAEIGIIELTTGASPITQWNLLFRGCPATGRHVSKGVLGSARLRAHPASGRAAGRARARL